MNSSLIGDIEAHINHFRKDKTPPSDADIFRSTHHLADNMVDITISKQLCEAEAKALRDTIVVHFAKLIGLAEFLFEKEVSQVKEK